MLPVIAILPESGLDLVEEGLEEKELLVLLPDGVQVVLPVLLELGLDVTEQIGHMYSYISKSIKIDKFF